MDARHRGGGGVVSAAANIARAGEREGCRPWPRYLLTRFDWSAFSDALADDRSLALIGMWAEPGRIHALFIHEAERAVLPVATLVAGANYPALSPGRPLAAWFERSIRDLWGYEAVAGTDARPWLDHGRWPNTQPMGMPPKPAGSGRPEPPEFLPAEGANLHEIGVGPIHAGIIEPGHFRFKAHGETIVRMETRLGYTHKGHLALMRGKPPRVAARFAARLSGDTTVAHSAAFARAVEAAAETEIPPRAEALRCSMIEVERIANHLGDIGAICNDAAYAPMLTDCGVLRERLLRACATAFGHRLMMDCVVPGGLAVDLAPGAPEIILRVLDEISARMPRLLHDYTETPSLADRTITAGRVDPRMVAAFAPGGVIGRAAGRAFDARAWPGTIPYTETPFVPQVRDGGDVDARIRVRFAEIADSLRIAETVFAAMPGGAVSMPLPPAPGEGIGVAEGFRGDIWHWVRLDAGLIAASFPRDPSWAHWPLLEDTVCNDIVADFPLCNKSFNASYSGVDL